MGSELFTPSLAPSNLKPAITEPLYREQDLGVELHIEPH